MHLHCNFSVLGEVKMLHRPRLRIPSLDQARSSLISEQHCNFSPSRGVVKPTRSATTMQSERIRLLTQDTIRVGQLLSEP